MSIQNLGRPALGTGHLTWPGTLSASNRVHWNFNGAGHANSITRSLYELAPVGPHMITHIIFGEGRKLSLFKSSFAQVAGLVNRNDFHIHHQVLIGLVRFLVNKPHTESIVVPVFPRTLGLTL